MRGLCYLILSVLSQACASTMNVVGFVGHNVTLPCSFDALAYGPLSFCWGKGKVPTSKCSNTILSCEDGTTQNQWGPRYQLRGAVEDGDVSLTVMNAIWSDAGVYGCRVEVPGWFNDLKVNIKLSIEEEPEKDTVTQTYTQPWTQGGMTTALSSESTEGPYVLRSATEEEFDFLTVLGVENIGRLAAVLLVTVILILAFIFRRRLLPKKDIEQVDTSAPENIYESIAMH